jgi:radical SAM superfamily enzyme YgiQ (UPF0313 family)
MGGWRLLLINPIQRLGGRRQRGWNGNRFVPPLNLAYVAALTPANWEIRIVDENAGHDARQFAAFVPDLVGISSYTATVPRAYELASHFRAWGIPVVIGGCHASAVPEETARYADVTFVGQAEGAWPRLLEDFERGQLQAIYEGGTPLLDGLPIPRRDLYPHRYLFDAVLTSKGCPYRCEFCSVWKMYEKRYLLRPVDEVLDELEQVQARHVFLMDDNLTANPSRAIALCQGMVERRLNKRFAIQASLEMGQNEELLCWLQRAGCFLVFVGIESLDESTLQHLRKTANLKVGIARYAETIDRIHGHGMAVSAGIIFGNDNDTLETCRHLEEFAVESGIDSPVYTILTPLPGTDLWERLKTEGRLLAHDLPEGYSYFDAHHVTYEPLRMTAADLLAAKRRAVCRATSGSALLRGLWQTWRRTGNLLATMASFQNSRWARINARSGQQRRNVSNGG